MKYWGIGICLLLALVLSCTLFEYSGKIIVDSVEGGATIRNDTIMAQYQEYFTIVLRTDPPYSKQNGSINFYLAEVNGHAPPPGTEGMEMGPGASPIDPTSGICHSENWYCDFPIDTIVTVDAYILDVGKKIEGTRTAITIKSVGYSGKIIVDSVEGGATIRNDTIMTQYHEYFTIVLRTDPPYSKQNGSINFYLAEVNGHAPPPGTEGMEMGPGASSIDPTSGICRSENWYCDPPIDTVVTVDAYIFDAGEKIEKTQTAITIKSVGP